MHNFIKVLLVIFPFLSYAQNVYTVDAADKLPPVISGHLKLGSNTAPNGDMLNANSLYFLKNGKPWYPVMGEFHFSRYPRQFWEEAILKMKAAGIDVIATYVFWIYHEEEEGRFNWSGDNDLKAFAELCRKHNVYLFARIGPWCHGEVRNGGFPDWLVKRGNTRKNNGEYLASVKRLYTEIGSQLKGLYFKEGGPVIGAQIENEYRFNNPAGLEHILTLKKMALEAGIDVPFYTATGWPGSNQQQLELIPVWGAYPEAPWDKKTTRLKLSENYLFGPLRNDPAIGADLFGAQDQMTDFKGYRYPYATAEMGGGNQITYHRRPIIAADDVTALAYTKVGSGANLMGYYMFHGGSNPIGRNSTLQESKATAYPNDYPIISYDFLSPIGEWGQLRRSYRGFKTLHTFLNDFGAELALTYPAFPEQKVQGAADNTTLRFAVRSGEKSGFVFISNYQRQLEMRDVENVQFELKLKDSSRLKFPENTITIKKNLQAIFPFNMAIGQANLRYATAQPFCRLNTPVPVLVFFEPEGIKSEFVFDKTGLTNIEAGDATVSSSASDFRISGIKAGLNCGLRLKFTDGKELDILVLNSQQALNAWKVSDAAGEQLFLSEQDLSFPEGRLKLNSTGSNEMQFSVFPDVALGFDSELKFEKHREGRFNTYTLRLHARKMKVSFQEVKDIRKFLNKGELLPANDLNPKATAGSPGPQYQTNLTDVKGARYYQISIPSSAFKGAGDSFLSVDYSGDTGSAYFKGKLIADDFYTGLPMQIGLKRFPQLSSGKLLLQIVPLTDERQIYFEEGVREPLREKEVAELRSVSISPQYEVLIRRGK